jgi:hypothetical protein
MGDTIGATSIFEELPSGMTIHALHWKPKTKLHPTPVVLVHVSLACFVSASTLGSIFFTIQSSICAQGLYADLL